jgi:WD40 repeat protein
MSLSITPVGNANTTQQSAFTHNYPSTDILRLICSFLDTPKDVVHFGLANRRLTVLLTDNELWNSLLHKHFPDSYAKLESRAESSDAYKRLTNIVYHMKAGKYRLWILSGHQDYVDCMTIWNHKLISGSQDGTIKIWDLHKDQSLLTLEGYPDKIRCMIVWDDKLIFSSGYFTLVWDLNTGQELRAFFHDEKMTCMTVWDNKLIFSSEDKVIKISDLNTRRLLQKLKGHRDWVRCMLIWNDKLISGADDKTIKIWDLHTGQNLQTLKGHRDWIRCMLIWNGKLISGSDDKTIKIWDLHTGQNLQTLRGHRSWIRCMTIWNDKLFSGVDNKTIKIWDLYTGEELRTLKTQNSVECMILWDDQLFTDSSKGKIKIYDFRGSSDW